MVRRRRRQGQVTQVGVYNSKIRKYRDKPVFQNSKNLGTKKGLFKRAGNKRRYIPAKYKKNVVRRSAGMPGLEKPKKRRRRRK